MTSAPRVERVDDLVVDSQGLDPPTEKWLQAAREAADTDGIRENAYAERLQMCISCCTLMCMFPMVPNMYRVTRPDAKRVLCRHPKVRGACRYGLKCHYGTAVRPACCGTGWERGRDG